MHGLVLPPLGRGDERRELPRAARDAPLPLPLEHNRVRDAPRRGAVLPVAVHREDPREVLPGYPLEQLVGGLPPGLVEAEVEGPVLLRPEAAAGLVELGGGDAEVKEDARDGSRVEHLGRRG